MPKPWLWTESMRNIELSKSYVVLGDGDLGSGQGCQLGAGVFSNRWLALGTRIGTPLPFSVLGLIPDRSEPGTEMAHVRCS